MSNVYNLEPPTKGKVVLHTNLGDLDIELWPKEAPKAVRNFVQLCLEGYYDNTIFHRVIKDYMVQGGDPTGTGTGGESVFGGLFKDEFHQRLKFNHRGLVACANQNQPHTNGSQFFITLDKCEWLDKKNTIFGKVVGDTIYNLARYNEVDTDSETDRPYYPPVINSAEVLWNPFEDIIPRTHAKLKQEVKEEKEDSPRPGARAGTKAGGKAGRNLALLSFGEQAEEEEDTSAAAAKVPRKIRAAHDVLKDEKLVKEEEIPEEERIRVERPAKRQAREAGAQDAQGGGGGGGSALDRAKAAIAAKLAGAAAREEDGDEDEEGDAGDQDFAARMRARVMDKRRQMGGDDDDGGGGKHSSRAGGAQAAAEQSEEPDQEEEEDEEGGAGGQGRGKDGRRGGRSVREEWTEKLEATKREKRAQGKMQQAAGLEVSDADLLKPWQVSREMYKQRKRVTASREKDTLARLKAFQSKLRTEGAEPQLQAPAAEEAPAKEEQRQDQQQPGGGTEDKGYAGKVRTDIDHSTYMPAAWRADDYLDGDFQDTTLSDLRSHKLSFKASTVQDPMARRDEADDYVVFDPLLEAAKGKFSKKAQDEKKRRSEWAGRSNV